MEDCLPNIVGSLQGRSPQVCRIISVNTSNKTKPCNISPRKGTANEHLEIVSNFTLN